MPKHVFIWVAYPRATSLCAGMADAYQAGVERGGAQVRRMDLNDMSFDLDFEGYSERPPALEPDLLEWQDNVRWADHLFIVHPYWWGAVPTKAKAILDRALLPGFGFKYHRKGMSWNRLLEGKTADAIITSDTPPLLDAIIYRKPARRVMKNQVLGFCGVKAKTTAQFGSVKLSSPETIKKWIGRAERMGVQAGA
jgi:NAD(P)H dehydrogenase (quinone)